MLTRARKAALLSTDKQPQGLTEPSISQGKRGSGRIQPDCDHGSKPKSKKKRPRLRALSARRSCPLGSRCPFQGHAAVGVRDSSSDEPAAAYQDQARAAVARIAAIEPRFQPLIARFGLPDFGRRDVFSSLLRAIVYQQISGKAGRAIWERFVALVGEPASKILPCSVVERHVEELREVGLSRRKAEYVLGAAEFFHRERLMDNELEKMSDDDILERLVKIRGVGAWTVHMILMFSLRRMDVLPVGDLGVRKGAAIFFKNGKGTPLSEKALLDVFERFRGQRSFASWYMWRVCHKDFKVPQILADE